ncbi:MAG TPA: hypothetical protein VFU53_02265, partial [Burkholderiales bacterium]|nr:hypothetical protein [Burkholderiales bacterium]
RPLLLVLAALPAFAQDEAAPVNQRMPLTHVAVLVFPTNAAAKNLAGSAQSRLEQILTENNVEVTDRDESKKIKSIWKKLEDPGYFVTADDFVKNTSSYQLDGIVRVYLSADSTVSPGGFFSATAQADVRLVDESAKVQAQVSYPMGAPGRPPSDGLTAQAALLNAMQRAIDEAAGSLGLEISQPASPRAMKFLLEGPVDAPAQAAPVARAPRDLKADYVGLAQMESRRNTNEKATCADRAPGGDVGAVGGSLNTLARGPHGMEMHFGSRVHLVDLAQQREITAFETRKLGRKPKEHRGTSQVLDCMFVHSWRYLAAVTGDVLSLWDTERGLQLSESLLPFGTEEASLEVLRAGEAYFLRVKGKDEQHALYRIAPGKN